MSAHLEAPEATRSNEPMQNDGPAGAELLDLFGDEYTRRVFEAVAEQPRGGRAVAEVANVSRATAYRRLNDLRDAGLVRTEMALCEDGHHREQYEAVAESLSVSFEDGQIEAMVSVDD
ncbi:helix-turn-helix domain-containing protein [Halorientalis brevis]|uniref:Helix-turn-helix domain-containing protein n=1 Tax=Halorientalis brevis TaxID=1126241 RepID=A0ABD6CFQ0_9EURY|nr:winged helix-turn-helix domain-containing protein [Halorientalis brevis]